MTPYYQDSLVTIYHGDCREWMPAGCNHFPLDSECPWCGQRAPSAVVSDPPYGISLDTTARYGANADFRAIIGDEERFDPAWVLRLGLSTLLWGANHYAHDLPISRGWIVWNKVVYDGAFGSKAMDKRQAEVELGWTNFLPRPKGYRHLWDGVYRDSEHGERYHPAQKPVALMEWCISLLPTRDGSILDPYMGAGPTVVAAKRMGRRAIGIEIEERYCEIAATRCSQEVLGLSA